jgi:site-specific DNA-methyltransferase (adenine-specific)
MKIEEMLNKVICADCLEFMKDIPDKSIDLTVTSPPYDNLRDYNGYTFDFEGIAKELYRITKEGGVVVWVVGDATIKGSETGTSFKQALYFKDIGFNLHDTMIWRKPNPMPYIKKDTYTPSFEFMFVFVRGKPKTYNLILEKCKYAGRVIKTHTTNPESIRKPNQTKPTKDTKIKSNVWDYVVAGTNYGHPAIFPEKLAEDHILSWSNEGDTILDPMAGSGTTLKMAKKNNRNYIGIEISHEYCDIINKRLNTLKQDKLL